jgi:hypothetical protein
VIDLHIAEHPRRAPVETIRAGDLGERDGSELVVGDLEHRSAGSVGVHPSSGAEPATRYGCGPVPNGAASALSFVAATVWVRPSAPNR